MLKKRVKVIPCEIYSRVVGYFRPVQSWNDGKQREFYDRKEVKINTYIKILEHRSRAK
jgi:anaerobic ribonucleoside-triphosphate reductase